MAVADVTESAAFQVRCLEATVAKSVKAGKRFAPLAIDSAARLQVIRKIRFIGNAPFAVALAVGKAFCIEYPSCVGV